MRDAGNSLIEYALPMTVFLVTGAVIVAMADIPQRLTGYFSDTLNGSVEGQSLRVEALGTLHETGDSGSPAEAIPSHSATMQKLDVSRLPAAMATGSVDIETAGSNGTEQALAILDKAIAQLASADELTPQEASLLAALSNEGHRIAAIQKIIETHAAAYDPASGKPFGHQSVTFDGETKDMQAWADDLSYGSTSTRFRKLYENAMQSDLLISNPEARVMVDQAVDTIVDLKREFEHSIDASAQDSKVERITGSMSGKKTDQESETVCTTGGGKDSGSRCQ